MTASFDTLIQKLKEAQKPDPAIEDDLQRSTWVRSLAAVNAFLKEEGVSRDLRATFLHLATALDDLSEGRTHRSLVRTTPKPNADKKALFEARQWGLACAAVTILKDYGRTTDGSRITLTEALKTAAGELGADWKKLREFRKNIGKTKAPAAAIEQYEMALKRFNLPGASLPPEQEAYQLLAVVKQMREKG